MTNPTKFLSTTVLTILFGIVVTSQVWAQDEVSRMTAERLSEIIQRVDATAVREAGSWYFHIEGLETAVED